MRCVLVLLALGVAFAGRAQRRPGPPSRPPVVRPAEPVSVRYARLDQVARQLPEAQAASLDKLAAALAAQARSDDDKARLVFAWIAYHIAYDVAFLQGAAAPQVAPEQVLRSRVAICQGYADLFTDLATRMGLEAETVSGYASIDRTLPTCPALGTDGGHAWNVYQAAGCPHIADACWGAGAVSADNKKFTQDFNAFWFDTPPAQAIFLHWPSRAAWQLLPTPVDSGTFRRWPYVDDAWFKLGVSGASMRRALAPVKNRPRPKPLPLLYATPHEVRIVQVPRPATLTAGQPATFVFTVGPGVEVGLEGYGFVVPAEARGNYRRLVVTPAASATPRIVAWHQGDSTHWTLLKYQVARPAPRRPTAADSVSYLRR